MAFPSFSRVTFDYKFPKVSYGYGTSFETNVVRLSDRVWNLKVYPQGENKTSEYLAVVLVYNSGSRVKVSYNVHLFVDNAAVQDFASKQPFLCSPGSNAFHLLTNIRKFDRMKSELHIEVELEMHPESQSPSPLKRKFSTIADETSQMLFNADESDLTIKVGKTGIPVHRLILCCRSKVFKAMMNSNMAESTSGIIKISDFDVVVVKEFLRFLYTDKCSEDAMKKYAEQLLAISSKYQVESLMETCVQHLVSSLDDNNAGKLLVLADLYSVQFLKTSALEYITRNSTSVVSKKGFFDDINPALTQDLVKALSGVPVK